MAGKDLNIRGTIIKQKKGFTKEQLRKRAAARAKRSGAGLFKQISESFGFGSNEPDKKKK